VIKDFHIHHRKCLKGNKKKTDTLIDKLAKYMKRKVTKEEIEMANKSISI
jgi:hypothetical protein